MRANGNTLADGVRAWHHEGMEFAITGLDDMIALAGRDNMPNVNASIASGMTRYIQDWYRERGNDYFDNPALPTHGAGRKDTNWAQGIPDRWSEGASDADSFSIVFGEGGDRYGLALKIKGGTVSATSAKCLTIPISPEAHGRSVADYERDMGVELFRPRGHDTLCYSLPDGKLRAVYKLRYSQFFRPWPEAVPSTEELGAIAAVMACKLLEPFSDGGRSSTVSEGWYDSGYKP